MFILFFFVFKKKLCSSDFGFHGSWWAIKKIIKYNLTNSILDFSFVVNLYSLAILYSKKINNVLSHWWIVQVKTNCIKKLKEKYREKDNLVSTKLISSGFLIFKLYWFLFLYILTLIYEIFGWLLWCMCWSWSYLIST